MKSGFSPAYAQRIQSMNPSAIREILKLVSSTDTISFGGGLPAPELFPKEQLAAITEEVIRQQGVQALQYASTDGLSELREKILERMQEKLGFSGLSLENIALLNGSQQGLDMLGKVFLDKGDVVFVETPTYLAAINAFKAYQPKIVGIAMDEDGIIIEDLKRKMQEYPNAKFLYTIPEFQNPTGLSMRLERRKALLETVAASNLLIVEDNPYGELRYSGETVPPLKALDQRGQVVYLSTFSKILVPGFRLGWVIGAAEIVQKLMIAKQAADLQCNTLVQYIINAYMERCDLDAHVRKIRQVYQHRRDLMLQTLKEEMPESVSWTTPSGGLFLWLTFPKEVDSAMLLKKCIEHGVAYVPGDSFYPNEPERNHCRINFSFVPDETLIAGVKGMAAAMEEYGIQ